MPISCSIQSCKNNKSKNPDLHFHKFPKDKLTCDLWAKACRREDKFNISTGRICSDHFLETDYERDLKRELLGLPVPKCGPQLKKNALPSRNLPIPSCVPTSTSVPQPSQRTIRMDLKRKKTEHREIVEAAISCNSDPLVHDDPDDPPPLQDDLNDASLQHNISIPDPVQELILLQTKHDELKKDFETLQITFRKSQKIVRALRRKVTKLQKQTKKLEELDIERKKLKKATAAFQKEKNQWKTTNKIKEDFYIGGSKIFTPNQIKLISERQTRVRWTPEELSQGFTLRYLNQKSYQHLRLELHYPLPALTTLQRWAQKIDLCNGFIEAVFQFMERIGEMMDPFEKKTILLFDEMKVQELYEYDIRRDEIIGPCKQMQVIMARGLTAKWKQVIYIDFDQKMTKNILTAAVMLLKKIKFDVVGCVSDLGGGNISLMNQLGVTKDNPSFHLEGYDRPIVYFPDAPHLLKLTRNWLIDYGFKLDGEIISIEPIRELIQLTNQTEVRAAHKLTEDHLPKKKSFSRQNVRKAVELLSHSTAESLKFFEEKNKLKSNYCRSTANFLTVIDKWFDLVNVRYVDRGKFTPAERKPYGMNLDEQNLILHEMAETISKMEINDSRFSTLQIFQKGLIQHTRAMKALYDNLHAEGVSYFLPNKTNQDALENFFMQERIHCGSNTSPTPVQAKQNARLIFLGKNPGVVTKNKNALTEENDTQETFILARALAPYQRTNQQDDVDNGVEETEIDEVDEIDLPVLEEDYGHEEDDVEEEGPADDFQENELGSPSFENNATSAEIPAITNSDEYNADKYDVTKEEGHEWLCGWIAMKFKSIYPHLQKPRDQASTVNIEHQYSEKPPPSYVEFLSHGGLVIPTEEFLTICEILDSIFNQINGDDFFRGPGLLTKLCDEADAVLSMAQKDVTPPKVIKRYFKLRICIRVKYKNQNLKQTKLKKKLRDIEKLRKIAT